MPADLGQTVTPAQVANHCGRSESVVLEWVDQGILPTSKTASGLIPWGAFVGFTEKFGFPTPKAVPANPEGEEARE